MAIDRSDTDQVLEAGRFHEVVGKVRYESGNTAEQKIRLRILYNKYQQAGRYCKA